MILILTEKPSVTRQVKDVLCPNARYIQVSPATKSTPPVGYYEGTGYEGNRYLICNSVGHIVAIKNPKDIDSSFIWDLNCLPYAFPDPLPLEIENKKVFKGIETAFQKYDYDAIYIATDYDREGSNIWRKINLMLKPYKTRKTLRMQISEWTPEGIRQAYDEAVDISEDLPLQEAALARESADYILGMNVTTAMTVKYAKGKGNVITVGRVQTPTAKFLYEREKEIQNFIPEPYTSVSVSTDSEEAGIPLVLKMKGQGVSRTRAEEIRDKMPDTLILKKSEKVSRKKCPDLYDMTSLSQDMNKRYGFSAKKTADIAQALYQTHTLTTYPGTNACKISEGTAEMAWEAFKNLPSDYSAFVKQISDENWEPAKHTVTSEALAHEAITPVFGTAERNAVDKLSKDERIVYDAIVQRFLQIFYPDAVYEEAVVSAEACSEVFEAKGKILKEKGWTVVMGTGKDTLLPSVQDGEAYHVRETILEDKMTKPPARYTEDTLLQAMKNAGRFVCDEEETKILKQVEGLGTGRTRPAIIENLKKREYFKLNKKTIVPTRKCMDLFETMPETTLTSPSLTADFEQMIQEIEEGRLHYADFMKKINTDVHDIVKRIKEDKSGKMIEQGNTAQSQGKEAQTDWGVCPICGKPLQENSKAVGCSGWRDGCKFTVWKTVAQKKLTQKQLSNLLKNGDSGLIKGFTSRKGTKFDAHLVMKDDYTTEFRFEDAPAKNTGGTANTKRRFGNR